MNISEEERREIVRDSGIVSALAEQRSLLHHALETWVETGSTLVGRTALAELDEHIAELTSARNSLANTLKEQQ